MEERENWILFFFLFFISISLCMEERENWIKNNFLMFSVVTSKSKCSYGSLNVDLFLVFGVLTNAFKDHCRIMTEHQRQGPNLKRSFKHYLNGLLVMINPLCPLHKLMSLIFVFNFQPSCILANTFTNLHGINFLRETPSPWSGN